MNRKALKRFLPITIKSLWFVLALNLVAFALTYLSYLSLEYLFSNTSVPKLWKLAGLFSLTLTPILVLFAIARRQRWRDANFVLLFVLAALSTVSFFALVDSMISILNGR